MLGAGGFSTLSLKDMTRSGPTLCRVRKTTTSSYYPQIKRVMPMRFRWLPFSPLLVLIVNVISFSLFRGDSVFLHPFFHRDIGGDHFGDDVLALRG